MCPDYHQHQQLRDYYLPKLQQESNSGLKLGWESETTQQLRFQVLIEKVDLTGLTLLDVGCGLGDLAHWLMEHGVHCHYTGIDLLPEMIDQAQALVTKRFPQYASEQPHPQFFCADLFSTTVAQLSPFDIVYASGIFNLRAEDNWGDVTRITAQMKRISKQAMIFNLLHEHSPGKEADRYFYYNPERVDAIVRSHGADTVEIIDNYLSNDFTVFAR